MTGDTRGVEEVAPWRPYEGGRERGKGYKGGVKGGEKGERVIVSGREYHSTGIEKGWLVTSTASSLLRADALKGSDRLRPSGTGTRRCAYTNDAQRKARVVATRMRMRVRIDGWYSGQKDV
jgi:hypothetical protein